MRRVVTPFVVVLAASAGAAPPQFHTLVASDNPDLWYRFDESSGTTAVNHGALGAAFNGRIVNAPAFGAPTIQGDPGFCFHSPNLQYVESMTDAPAAYLGNPSFTAEAVVRVRSLTTNAGYPPFLHWGQPGTSRSVYFSVHHTNPSKAYVGFYNGGQRTVGTHALNEWVHLVWVRDSAGGANNPQQGSTLYVNGEAVPLELDTVLCCNTAMPNVQAAPFRVQRADDFTRFFSGDVDEVALYPRLLSAQEVREHYDALIGGRPCVADCDTFTGVGVLDIFDFLCFQNRFDAGDPRADCERSGCAVVLDIFDFLCFQNAFDAGCP